MGQPARPLPARRLKNWSRSRSWRRCRLRTSCSRCGTGCGSGPTSTEPAGGACRCAIWPACGGSCFQRNSADWRKLLIERVVIADGGLEIIWRDQGWQELAGELLPGTIGAEIAGMGSRRRKWHEAESAALWAAIARERRDGGQVKLSTFIPLKIRKRGGSKVVVRRMARSSRRARSPARSTSPCWWR